MFLDYLMPQTDIYSTVLKLKKVKEKEYDM